MDNNENICTILYFNTHNYYLYNSAIVFPRNPHSSAATDLNVRNILELGIPVIDSTAEDINSTKDPNV